MYIADEFKTNRRHDEMEKLHENKVKHGDIASVMVMDGEMSWKKKGTKKKDKSNCFIRLFFCMTSLLTLFYRLSCL
jgi:hypothetical protein